MGYFVFSKYSYKAFANCDLRSINLSGCFNLIEIAPVLSLEIKIFYLLIF